MQAQTIFPKGNKNVNKKRPSHILSLQEHSCLELTWVLLLWFYLLYRLYSAISVVSISFHSFHSIIFIYSVLPLFSIALIFFPRCVSISYFLYALFPLSFSVPFSTFSIVNCTQYQTNKLNPNYLFYSSKAGLTPGQRAVYVRTEMTGQSQQQVCLQIQIPWIMF